MCKQEKKNGTEMVHTRASMRSLARTTRSGRTPSPPALALVHRPRPRRARGDKCSTPKLSPPAVPAADAPTGKVLALPHKADAIEEINAGMAKEIEVQAVNTEDVIAHALRTAAEHIGAKRSQMEAVRSSHSNTQLRAGDSTPCVALNSPTRRQAVQLLRSHAYCRERSGTDHMSCSPTRTLEESLADEQTHLVDFVRSIAPRA